jgi:GT2 family glycosyltransferase
VSVQAGRVLESNSLAGRHRHGGNILPDSIPQSLRFAPTMNFIFKKQVIDQIDNFDPWFKRGGEDLDFCIRLRNAGYRILSNPAAVIYHASTYGPRKAWRDGRSRAQAFVKHRREMMLDALVIYFHIASIFGSILFLMVGNLGFAGIAILPSIVHRLRKAWASMADGSKGFKALMVSLQAYISYASFFIFLPIMALERNMNGSRTGLDSA